MLGKVKERGDISLKAWAGKFETEKVTSISLETEVWDRERERERDEAYLKKKER